MVECSLLKMCSVTLEINKRYTELSLPFKVIHGTGDRVTSYHESQLLYDSAASKDKEIALMCVPV